MTTAIKHCLFLFTFNTYWIVVNVCWSQVTRMRQWINCVKPLKLSCDFRSFWLVLYKKKMKPNNEQLSWRLSQISFSPFDFSRIFAWNIVIAWRLLKSMINFSDDSQNNGLQTQNVLPSKQLQPQCPVYRTAIKLPRVQY